jgi:hypothetical protein
MPALVNEQMSAATGANRRTVKWSQRRSTVTLVVDRRGLDNAVELVSPTVVRVGSDAPVEFVLHAPVAGLKANDPGTADTFTVHMVKEDDDGGYWPALLAVDGGTPPPVIARCDWARWIDEDDEDARRRRVSTKRLYLGSQNSGGIRGK